jgi:hypothetical protein
MPENLTRRNTCVLHTAVAHLRTCLLRTCLLHTAFYRGRSHTIRPLEISLEVSTLAGRGNLQDVLPDSPGQQHEASGRADQAGFANVDDFESPRFHPIHAASNPVRVNH